MTQSRFVIATIIVASLVLIASTMLSSNSPSGILQYQEDDGGTKHYYISYEARNKRYEAFGVIYLVYPDSDKRGRFWFSEYQPGGFEFSELFSTDTGGGAGEVKMAHGIAQMDELGLSLPSNLTRPLEWTSSRRGVSGKCTQVQSSASRKSVTCDFADKRVSFQYKDHVGIEEYDGYCRDEVCRFRLKSSAGLLGSAHLELIGLMPKTVPTSR
jgi:hypothetical protein